MPVTAVEQQVRRTLLRHDLCPPGTRLVVGLSGGSDSVALTLLLVGLSRHLRFEVVGCAHLNHQLRPSAERDEQFCRDFCDRMRLPIVIDRARVLDRVGVERRSVEAVARKIRYEFLGHAASEMGADRIAVGHTQDDQAETLLLKLVRGSGLTGLAGIYPRRGQVVRPLLEVSRRDLRDWLTARAQGWMDDESNDDEANPRNRLRHRILPELGRLFGGDPKPAIARAAALIREDAEWLDGQADHAWQRLRRPASDGGWTVGLDEVRHLPSPLRRRLLLLALRQVADGLEVGREHVASAEEVVLGGPAGVDVPGGRVERRHDELVLLQRRAAAK